MAQQLDLSVDRGASVPVGAQLATRFRRAMSDGSLGAGHRLPSVRELAEAAGVNVNTARAVYARLESEGLVRSEQGRGTFVTGAPEGAVATPREDAAPGTPGAEAAARHELRRQIALLEAALVRVPPTELPAMLRDSGSSRQAAVLLSARDLAVVRDELLGRLRELDAQRAAVMQRLEALRLEETGDAERAAPRRATPSLAGARIRWVGA